MVADGRLRSELDAAIKARDPKLCLAYARAVAGNGLDFQAEQQLAASFDDLSSICDSLEPLKLAVLSSGTIDHFLPILRLRLLLAGYRATLYTPDYDTVSQVVRDDASALYRFRPDAIWLMTTFRDVVGEIGAADAASGDAMQAFERIRDQVSQIGSRSDALVIVGNSDEPPETGIGNFEAVSGDGRVATVREFNRQLERNLPTGAVCFDFAGVANSVGMLNWHDRRFWFHSKHQFQFDAYGILAHRFSRLLAGARGRSAKCLVLDLDNTLWGGVIGDDGVENIELGYGADGEAFVALQAYAKHLSQRGILLAVCSKNEKSTAELPFLKHPDMKLTLDDFSCFQANWRNKADNLKEIAATLNIREDALVFIDDNPVERDLVRRMAPDVWVPELPEDPDAYVQTIDQARLFESIQFTAEDAERVRLYRDNAKRNAQKHNHSDMVSYLKSLEMRAEIAGIDGIPFKRAVQLINKSNQFNLTGGRISEAEAQARLDDESSVERTFRLKDKFGDNGLISVVLARRRDDALILDTWVMSCRVLERGMEHFIMSEMVRTAKALGCRRIRGVYRPSGRNELVSSLYERLGFVRSDLGDEDGATWDLSVDHGDFSSQITAEIMDREAENV